MATMASHFALVLSTLIVTFSLSLAQTTNRSLITDPGPRNFCYNFYANVYNNPSTIQTMDYSQCANTAANNDPSWTFGWYNAGNFTGFTSGGNGLGITIPIVNNAKVENSDCKAIEPYLKYDYPGYGLVKEEPSDVGINLANYQQWVVEYDVLIHPDTTPCAECTGCYSSNTNFNRKWVTTDFIYWWSACDGCTTYKNLISIIHYNPIQTGASNGPFQWDGGYRIQINGPPTVTPGVTTHVALDFRALLNKYNLDLCHGGVFPNDPTGATLQIISSNVNASSFIEVSNVKFSLVNGSSTVYPLPTYAPSTTAPSYCPAPPSSGACHVAWTVTDWWAQGYNVDIVLKNLQTSTVTGWETDWALGSGESVSSMWNAVYTESGSSVTAQNVTYNGVLAANGGTVEFGFTASSTSTLSGAPPPPGTITMNGLICAIN